ncbi:hypothetical protein ACLOJK_013996 [Asimina triloba]
MAAAMSEVAVPAAAAGGGGGNQAEEERRMVRFPPRRGLVKSMIYEAVAQALRSLVEDHPPEKSVASTPPPHHRPYSTHAGAPRPWKLNLEVLCSLKSSWEGWSPPRSNLAEEEVEKIKEIKEKCVETAKSVDVDRPDLCSTGYGELQGCNKCL